MRDRKCAGKLAALVFCLMLNMTFLSACGDSKIVFTTGFGRNEVFKIGGSVCTTAEIMVYLTNAQNRYESAYGREIWDVSREGVTLEQKIKENVLAECARIKATYLLAAEKGLELDDRERKLVRQAAEEYYGSLSDREKELMGVELSTIEKMYTEYVLAGKVYRYLIRDINPEISDDEARTITVQHILLRTLIFSDEAGGLVELSAGEKKELYRKACDIRSQASEEGVDFAELAAKYSEDPTVTYSFGKGQMEEIFEDTAFSLETGEISEVVETRAGYHIIKCITTFDRAETDANKLLIVEERRREVFGEEYEAFVSSLMRQLNTKLWDEITLLRDGEVTTGSFFEVCKKYFPEV